VLRKGERGIGKFKCFNLVFGFC
jgi:hypothetical protein